jgi:hypothetical protein
VEKPMKKFFTLLTFIFSLCIFLVQNSYAYNKLEFILDNKTENIKIYPNPIVDDALIKISPDIDLVENKVSVVFYNLLGKEIYKIYQVKEYEIKLSKEVFRSNGVYFYQLKLDDRIQNTGKLIIK